MVISTKPRLGTELTQAGVTFTFWEAAQAEIVTPLGQSAERASARLDLGRAPLSRTRRVEPAHHAPGPLDSRTFRRCCSRLRISGHA